MSRFSQFYTNQSEALKIKVFSLKPPTFGWVTLHPAVCNLYMLKVLMLVQYHMLPCGVYVTVSDIVFEVEVVLSGGSVA